MSAEKILEQFESAYLRGDFYVAEQDSEVKFQDFRKHCACVAFKNGWQASRVAIEVELPKVAEYFDQSEYPHTCEMLERDLRASIESLGLTVKQ